jgi:SAM-dependent methyltransferase
VEVDQIERQQVIFCLRCGANLRSMALALAISGAANMRPRFFSAFALRRPWLRVLEVNTASDLHRHLRRLPRHALVTYPEVDFTALPFPDSSYDLVVHSDTLEHVIGPERALTEALRVLRRGGFTCYTVPFVAGRLTRSTAGCPVTYHGYEDTPDDGYIVRTEYGSDFWEQSVMAGFAEVRLFAAVPGVAVAIAARKG